MFKSFKVWLAAAAAAVGGWAAHVGWTDLANKAAEHGAKSQCEAHVTTDTCMIDQACTWDFDAKACKDKK